MERVINIRIIITFCLVVLFFGGGIFLDYTASKTWIELSPDQALAESNKAIVKYARQQANNLAASAKLLYDFAKITLGVLLTLLPASSTVARVPRQPNE